MKIDYLLIIKNILNRSSINIQELCLTVGVSQSTFYNYKKNPSNIKLEEYFKILDYLKISPERLTENPERYEVNESPNAYELSEISQMKKTISAQEALINMQREEIERLRGKCK